MSDNTPQDLSETIKSPIGTVSITVTSNGRVTISKGQMPKTLENGMSIEYSESVLISVVPTTHCLGIKVSCVLNTSDIISTSATGECLDCIEWFNKIWHMTLGTEDTDNLQNRYPHIDIQTIPYPIKYNDSGIIMDLVLMNVPDVVSLHVIVSAKKLPDERDCTAWFFADIAHEQVVKAVCGNT